MQDGSVRVERRKQGPDVLCFRWREGGPDGRKVHRRIVLGTADELKTIASARKAVVGLTLADLSRDFQQRELVRGNTRIAYSTRKAYEGYLKKWIEPRWGEYRLSEIRAVEVELWLKSLDRASGTPVPAHDDLVEALRQWHSHTNYKSPENWVVASPANRGRWPYLAQQIMRHHILPVARRLCVNKRIGWHTFRHTYSTLLRSTGAESKIMQELLRHSTIRVTLDTYTQAVTTEKRSAQEAVVALLFPQKTPES